jgi:hypothetical protein
MIRERLQRMGLPLTEAAARSLVEAVLALEGPRLYAQAQGNLENSLEIIRDTAEAALRSLKVERKEEQSVAVVPPAMINDRRPVAPRRPELPDHVDEDEPRPVFKRPRR